METLNELHMRAIELKYKGLSFAEISKELNGELTTATLGVYFSENNLLYTAYIEYATKQNMMREAEGRARLKQGINVATDVMVKTINLIIKHADSIDLNTKTGMEAKIRFYKQAFYLSERLLDRAGLPAIIGSEVTNHTEKQEDYEQFLTRLGINPKTGHRKREPIAANN